VLDALGAIDLLTLEVLLQLSAGFNRIFNSHA
jgi:hypothetical protein